MIDLGYPYRRVEYKPGKANKGQVYDKIDDFINLMKFEGYWCESSSETLLALMNVPKERY